MLREIIVRLYQLQLQTDIFFSAKETIRKHECMQALLHHASRNMHVFHLTIIVTRVYIMILSYTYCAQIRSTEQSIDHFG